MSTRRWRRAAIGVAAGLASLSAPMLATPAHGAGHDLAHRSAYTVSSGVGPAVFAQAGDSSGEGSVDGSVGGSVGADGIADDGSGAVADGNIGSSSNVESVTTTETKLRRVVIGLIAIALVTAALTIGYARHTSPKRRARVAAEREEARARRLAAAAAVGGLGRAEPSVKPPAATLRPPTEEPAARAVNGSSSPRPRSRVRPDPRPQPPRSRG